MGKYKLMLIKPAQLKDGKPLRLERGLTPTRALPYVAALTPDAFDVTITDDSIEEIDYDTPVDLVGITSLVSQVPRAIQIADRFREKGVKVIAGGVGASSVPEIILPHVDSLVIGEAEGIWGTVLEDFSRNALRRTYRSDGFPALSGLPLPRFDLLMGKGYVQLGKGVAASDLPRIPIETARGCPHDCDFCSVTRHFGKSVRMRPVEEVIAEMKRFPHAYFFIVDDNVNANRERSKNLFRAMIPLGNRWSAQFSSLAAGDGELLDLARKAGCINAFVGIESIYGDTLRTAGKGHNLRRSPAETIAAFKNAGIDVNVSMIFGFDQDTPQSMRETIDFLIKQNVHLLSLFILTPIPGTQLHERMEQEGRILRRDLSLYDGAHAVFKPRHMSPDELEENYWHAFERFYTTPNMIRRFSDTLRWGWSHPLVPVLHTFMGNFFYRKAIRQRVHPLCGGKLGRSASQKIPSDENKDNSDQKNPSGL